MKTYLFLLLFVFQAFSLSSQISLKGYNQEKIDPSLFEGRWKARWISYPGEAPNVYGVYHFRKSFDLEVVPSRFIVHVSADNRYKLYVNGKLVSLGPARGDIYNWSFGGSGSLSEEREEYAGLRCLELCRAETCRPDQLRSDGFYPARQYGA